MNITLDIGNTRIKVGFFEKGDLEFVEQFKPTDVEAIKKLCTNYPVEKALICASGEVPVDLDIFLQSKFETRYFTHLSAFPFRNAYSTPLTLGKDRLAAVLGATTLYPNENCIVVIAGTALTFNILENNTFWGGSITPGLQMRFDALHHFTARLPQLHIKPDSNMPLVGNSTDLSIYSGVQNGFMAEIEGMLSRYTSRVQAPKIIFSGGDAPFVLKHLEGFEAVLQAHIVLIGLNEALRLPQI